MANEMAERLGYTNREAVSGKHVAMNMSLTNAIRMGLVVNPKLVSCAYNLKTDGSLDKLKDRIDQIEDIQEKNEKLAKYESLRRNVENADGIPEILQANVKRGGKYIVFLPIVDELEDEDGNVIGRKKGKDKIADYEKQITEYFKGSDITPNFHSMLGEYGDKDNEKRLEEFQNRDTDDTEFMLVMNKANEGIHLDKLDGMIWLRPMDENSRILYLQQLGRVIYSEDPDNPTKDEDRPVVIDLVNNTLKVNWKNEITEQDDIQMLNIIVDWAEGHDGTLPNINSTDKEETGYATVLKEIQNKYKGYLENEFDGLNEKQREEVQEILRLGSLIDLWQIELPEKITKAGETHGRSIKDKNVGPFEITGLLKDFVEIEGSVDKTNRIDNFEIAKQYIEFLKKYGKRPSPTFRKDGIVIKKLNEMTPEQRKEKRLYSRWNESLTRKLLDAKLQNQDIEIDSECNEVIDEIKELILQIESKENIEKIQEYVTFLEAYHRKPQVHFKKSGRALLVEELTESQKYEKNLGLRWKNSEVKQILDTYADRPINDVPKYYIDIIAKLRGLGELGEKKKKRKITKRETPIEEEILEFLNKHNRMPLGAISRDGKTLTSDEMNEDEKSEINLYTSWKRCKVKKYISMELSKVPEEYKEITFAISQKISDIKLYDESEIARDYLSFLETNMRTPIEAICRNGEYLKISEMSDIEKRESRLARNYRKSKIKEKFEKFERGEIDYLPKVWLGIYNQINTLLSEIDITEKIKIAKEYIEFIEKNGRIPRQQTTGKKQLKRNLKSDEQAYEESLARRWTNSYIKTVFEDYLEHPNEEILQEYKEPISRLIELGLKSSKKAYDKEQNIDDQIIEFLNKYNRMPRGAICKNGEVLGVSRMSTEEQEETKLYSRWNSSKECKVLKKFAGKPIEEIPKEYRESISKLREYGLGKKKMTTYEEVIEFLENHNGRMMRSSKENNTQEQNEERKLYNRWIYSKEYKVLNEYSGRSLEEVPEEYKEFISKMREYGYGLEKKKKRTGKEVAEASISSLTDIEMSDREDIALKELVEKTKEGGIEQDEQSQ